MTHADELEHFRKQIDKSRAACLHAVATIPGALAHVPEHLISERMYVAAMSGGHYTLGAVPIPMRTKAICDVALAKDPMSIALVPDALLDEAIVHNVVSRCGDALWCVPRDFRTAEVCLLAAQNMGQEGCAVNAFPKWIFKDLAIGRPGHQIMRAALQAAPIALGHAMGLYGHDALPPDLVMVSVARWGFTLAYLHPDHRTLELCQAAVDAHGLMLAHVPSEWVTYEMCERAVTASLREAGGLAPHEVLQLPQDAQDMGDPCHYEHVDPVLEHVPERFRGEVLCLAAIEATPDNAAFVPAVEWSPMLAEALGRRSLDDRLAAHVPEPLRDTFFDAVDAALKPRSPTPKGMQP